MDNNRTYGWCDPENPHQYIDDQSLTQQHGSPQIIQSQSQSQYESIENPQNVPQSNIEEQTVCLSSRSIKCIITAGIFIIAIGAFVLTLYFQDFFNL